MIFFMPQNNGVFTRNRWCKNKSTRPKHGNILLTGFLLTLRPFRTLCSPVDRPSFPPPPAWAAAQAGGPRPPGDGLRRVPGRRGRRHPRQAPRTRAPPQSGGRGKRVDLGRYFFLSFGGFLPHSPLGATADCYFFIFSCQSNFFFFVCF